MTRPERSGNGALRAARPGRGARRIAAAGPAAAERTTVAARPAAAQIAAALVAAAALAGCSDAAPAAGRGPGSAPSETAAAPAPPARAAPSRPARAAGDTLLVAVLRGRDTATVYADAGARLVDPATGRTVARAGAYRPFHFLVAGGGATAWGPWGELEASARRLRLVPASPDARVFIDGRPHRGQAEVVHRTDGTLTVASRVGREAYLTSVVAAELGDEGLAAFEAAKAQAVAARTWAVAMAGRGRRDSLGVDLVADPEVDQSYPGVLAEREAAARAVRATRGRILTWEGRPARTYYHSTCGGRTGRPEAIWDDEEARPYLRSVEDAPAGGGADFCAVSPHHRWSRSWTAAEVDDVVRPAAARAAGRRPGAVGAIRSVAVTARSAHGRVTELTVVTASGPGARESAPAETGGDSPGPGAAGAGSGAATADTGSDALATDTLRLGTREIPGALPAAGGGAASAGGPLRSTWFEVAEPPEPGGLALEGRGSGHGVGMCQWGAVARARRGASWREILATYYPGTEVRRVEEVGRGG